MSSAVDPQINWRKSFFCASGECIEIAVLLDGRIALRSEGSLITFSQAEFDAFCAGIKAGEFDDLTQ